MTPRRVLTWTFGLRTPFNPMSDAAAEATRLAPAGRACSKFIWQSCFLKNWAVRMPAFGPPCLSSNHQCSRAYYESPQGLAFCAALAVRPASIRFGRSSNVVASRTAGHRERLSPFTTPVRLPPPRLATLLPRLGVTPRGRNAADGGGQRRITVGALTRWPFDGLAGPEFVSEFETKRDQ